MSTAVYQPIVSIEVDGTIDTDWFQSYLWNVDADGNPTEEDARSDILDARLEAIRELLSTDLSPLAQLVRPFFVPQKRKP